MERERVACFPGATGRIPNFASAPAAAARLASLPEWRAAQAAAGVQGQGHRAGGWDHRLAGPEHDDRHDAGAGDDEQPAGGLLGCCAESTGHHDAEHNRRSDDGEADQQRHLVEVLGAESPFAGGPSLEDRAGPG
jgi:hypothetical protein